MALVPEAGCDGDAASPPARTWADCQASDQAFVRRAIMALAGRRPWGQAEVDLYEDIMIAARIWTREPNDAALPKRLVARALMEEDSFRLRWTDFLLDALRVLRTRFVQQTQGYDKVQTSSCYGPPLETPFDDGALALWVRDHGAAETGAPSDSFTLRSLVSSSLQLDDLSPVYRAHLFQLVAFPLAGANVDILELERARRQDFAATFETAYVHRDVGCLPCHNSRNSVTYSENDELNRHWPLPGQFELALYGSEEGTHPSAEQDEKGSDRLRASSMLRRLDVADGGGAPPWGWNATECGTFKLPSELDPLGVDTFFASIRSTPEEPQKGRRANVWALEAALRRGIDQLAENGLTLDAAGEIADPDEAFAYLVGSSIVEQVWTEVVGSRLTIPTNFPRTEIQRDILQSLTDSFVRSHFSLRTLLVDIVTHPAFNLAPPESGCGAAAYELPPIFDPWTRDDMDASRHPNSPADAVFPLSSRPLRRALHRALEWPFAPDFPEDEEEELQAALGFFLENAEPGFRGFDFQGRLTWERLYGACANPSAAPDFIANLLARGAATPGATVADAVVALKDRLLGEPSIAEAERQPLEALLKAKLDGTWFEGLEPGLRVACGVYVSSPQAMLGGLPPADDRTIPPLTPPERSYAAVCDEVAERMQAVEPAWVVDCQAKAVARIAR